MAGHYQYLNTRPMKNCWKYSRVSNERNDKKDSLTHQDSMIDAYIEENDLVLVGESSDDKSGMNFNREGFRELLAAVRAGIIDTILVKEISRFGRERALTLLVECNFSEKYTD